MSAKEFWQQVYIAAIRRGETAYEAGELADRAVYKYKALGAQHDGF